jgi:hypothetical protein
MRDSPLGNYDKAISDPATMLSLHRVNGVELRNFPAYIREWVTRERADRNTSEKRTKLSKGAEDA